ncbi:MAG TPA: hypothetical protein VFH92_14460, partial [Phenylobacterium sp.]|nr:hypothetical protein [Phenylobacterium sp.]
VMAENLDLLGDPIPENWGGRGRPPHLPTRANRNKIIVLLAMGWEEAKIAAAIGISKPTLRKHYFRELKVRDEARARLEGELITGMAAKALAGDVPAYREVRRALDKSDVQAVDAVYRPVAEAPANKAPRLGKKAQAQADAEQIAGIFEPGPPPARLTPH